MSDDFAETCYQRNYLKEVIAKVDFLSPLAGLETDLPKALSDHASKTFPIPEPVEAFRQEVKVGPLGLAPGERLKFTEWRFHGKDREKTVAFSAEALYVSHKAYQTYELMRGEFVDILSNIAAVFDGATLKRVGLRYVNQIELDEENPTDWTAYIAEPLLSPFTFPPTEDRPALSRVFHNLELAFEGYNLRFRWGMIVKGYVADDADSRAKPK